jgi:hypothetical protein
MSALESVTSFTANQARHMPRRATRVYTALRQVAVYGWAAPKWRETIHVDPGNIRALVTSKLKAHLVRKTGHQNGVVVGGDWDIDLVEYRDFRTKLVYRSCHAHWVDGVPWEETEIVRIYLDQLARGEPCPFVDVDALMRRYTRLDRVFDEVVRRQALSRRYEDLVQISIARDHTLLWGPDGRHRVTIALLAGLSSIPARVGFVHPLALPYFQSLRTHVPTRRSWFVLPGARGDEPPRPMPGSDRRRPSVDAGAVAPGDGTAPRAEA